MPNIRVNSDTHKAWAFSLLRIPLPMVLLAKGLLALGAGYALVGAPLRSGQQADRADVHGAQASLSPVATAHCDIGFIEHEEIPCYSHYHSVVAGVPLRCFQGLRSA